MSRLLDRGWDSRDPEAADRRRELQLLSQEVKNLGDLSRAMLLPWVNVVDDSTVQEVRGQLVERYLTKNRQMLRRGTIDQRIAAINLLAATVRGARARDNEPLQNTGPPPEDTAPGKARSGGRVPPAGGTAGGSRQSSPEKFRELRVQLRELSPDLIRLTRENGLGPRGSEVQAAAARALGELEADPAEVIPALEALLRGGSPGARRSAAFALENLLRILLPPENNLSGGGEMTTSPLNSTALSAKDAAARVETMRRILGVLPRALRDSDADVRLYAARIYHRIAFALLNAAPLPVPIPAADAVLDPRAVEQARYTLSVTESLFAEVAPLQRAFNDQARIMAAGAGDSNTQVQTEMCHALENVAQTLAKLRRVEESLQGLKKRLEGLPSQPPLDKEELLPGEKSKDREDMPKKNDKDDLPLAPGELPRKDRRRSGQPNAGPRLSWQSAAPPSLQVAREWGGSAPRAAETDLPMSDGLLPPIPAPSEQTTACSARLEAPVAVAPTPTPRVVPFHLVKRQKEDDQPDLLPPPRPAPEPRAGYRKEYIRAAVERLRDPSIRVRLAALSILEGMGRDAEDALPDLIPALSDGNRFVRWQAARIIGRLAPFDAQEAVPALMRRLNEYEDSQGRLAACVALQQYARLDPDTTAQAIPLLARLVHHGELDFRLQILETIRTIGRPAAVQALPSVAWVLKIDQDGSVRAAAARVLGYFGELSRPAIPTLRRAMKDDDPEVRRAASEAILAIEDTPGEP
jgi:HEAT repeat protein